MNNEYLTEAQAAEKLGYTGAVAADDFFVTKVRCIEMGATTDPLEKYPHWDFPAADDIVGKIYSGIGVLIAPHVIFADGSVAGDIEGLVDHPAFSLYRDH